MARKSRGGVAAEVMSRVNAQMRGEVLTMASNPKFVVTRCPTGSLTIDRLTDGGFARGRHIEVFGDWQAGKSLIGYMTLVLAQKRGEVCAIVDAESIFDSAWFTALGGSVEDLLMFEPKTANALGNVLRLFIQRDAEVQGVDVVLIDSVASLMTMEEAEYDLESDKDVRTASLARLMSLLLRQVTSANETTLFIWTNQWRDKIARIPGLKSTPGGLAMGFYASTRLELTKAEKETEPHKIAKGGGYVEKKRVVGQWVQVIVKKEKTGARPEGMAYVMLNYETGQWDEIRELIDLGMQDEIITRAGDYFTVMDGSDKRVHGIKRLRKTIEDDPELCEWLWYWINDKTNGGGGDG